MVSEEKNLKNQPIRNKSRLWRSCLLILIFLLANLAKGNMSFCHHLVSIVCHPFTFHILIFSSENPQPNELKLLVQRDKFEKKLLLRPGRRFLKIGQSETRIACGSHVWLWIITKCALFREDLP
jgi:hypothetical protein